MLNRLLGFGLPQFFKGLREGDVPTLALGALLLLMRYRRRNAKTAEPKSFTLKPGQSVALRVFRAGEEPVTYRIDA